MSIVLPLPADMPENPAIGPSTSLEQEVFISYVASSLDSALSKEGYKPSQFDSNPAVRVILAQSAEIDPKSLRDCLERAHLVKGLITVRSGGQGPLKSRRLSNIVLNYRSLTSEAFIASPTLPGAALIQDPVLRTLTYLLIVGALAQAAIRSLKVELSSRHARVFWVLFSKTPGAKGLAETRLLSLVNKDFAQHHQQTMPMVELKTTLSDLRNVRCVREAREGTWIVCDKVMIVPGAD